MGVTSMVLGSALAILLLHLSTSEALSSTDMSAPSASKAAARAIGKLHPSKTAVLLCDVQERFRPLIWRGETVIRTCRYVTGVADALNVPVVATQQYTKVFGETCKECFATEEQLEATPIYEKKKFSMCTEEVQEKLRNDFPSVQSYVIVGIEAHVCVLQTCLDLLERGRDVHVVCDGVSSQQPYDREIALQRLAQAGAFLTTAQSAAFMLMQTADHPNFKAVSKLTVEHMKLPNEFNDAMLQPAGSRSGA